VGQRRAHEALQAGDGEVPPSAASPTVSTLRRRHREAFVQLLYSAGKNPTRASLMKAYPQLERAEPVPPPGQPAEDGRYGSAADPVRADRQVHGRHVPARLEAQVRRRRD
jgi:hypothetical protein